MDDFLDSLLPAVDQQMDSPETAFVRTTFDRLVSEHEIDASEAKTMIALCLADEAERLLDEDRDFDLERYRTLLDLLPSLPE